MGENPGLRKGSLLGMHQLWAGEEEEVEEGGLC